MAHWLAPCRRYLDRARQEGHDRSLHPDTGVVLELAIRALSGRAEAWDSEQFWMIGLPFACLVSIAIGFLSRARNWMWTLVVAPSQVMTMMIRGGEIGNLWPLTLAASTILSAPFFVASFVGSRLRPARFR